MATYLLLRNNKESGPLSFEEIIKTGLKPYDLIWINGRSAAWRYANEIPEFIPYAPAETTETIIPAEQKMDEPAKESVSNPPLQKKPDDFTAKKPSRNESQQEDLKIERQQTNPPTNNSKVFVSLPEKKFVEKPVTHAEDQSKPTAFNLYEQKYMGLPETGKVNQPGNDNSQNVPVNKSFSETPVQLEDKYSQPLDEIKEMYVQTLNQRKKRNARKQALYNGLKVAAAASIILAIGMLIGIYFYSDTENKNVVEHVDPVSSDHSELNASSFVSDSRINPVSNNLSVNENEAENIIDYSVQVNEQKENQVAAKSTKKSSTKPIPYEGVIVDSQTNERNRVKRDDTNESSIAVNNEPSIKKGSVENIWDDVSISASDFKTGPFGGIKNLQVTLANNSAYPLDKVEIEVKFIGIERQVVKTQKMVFNDVLPGGQVHADVPKTGRGMDVDVSIKKINVKDFSFARSEK